MSFVPMRCEHSSQHGAGNHRGAVLLLTGQAGWAFCGASHTLQACRLQHRVLEELMISQSPCPQPQKGSC